MTRSPLAYPLNRTADLDAGGAADLQTDIMRFMAILSLCLVAIFALVQSIPLNPTEPVAPVTAIASAEQIAPPEPVTEAPEPAIEQPQELRAPTPVAKPTDANVILTRPKWTPKYPPGDRASVTVQEELPAEVAAPVPKPALPTEQEAQTVESAPEGFTLRFESDAALTRLVASNRIGVYAIAEGRAQRMTVGDSRISFWDASMPNTYHDMDALTVPSAVVEALARSGTAKKDVHWGVTLPGQLKSKLDELMLIHENGALVIVSSGDIQWEAS